MASCSAEDTGGAPNTTNPAASGSAGAASIAMCPPRLRPTITASAASTAAANPAGTAA